jgi:putative nucleotidyltransferase with HDIG domain
MFRRSLALHRALGTSPYVAHALNNLGILCTDLRRWRAAGRAFAEALEVCAEVGDTATQARVAGNSVEPLVARRRWSEARAACDEALRLAELAGEVATVGEVRRHQGVIARETGDGDAAAGFFADAARIAAERGDLLLGAQTAREEAVLHWRRHEHRETLRALNRAHALFSRLQARRDVADVAERLHGLESTFLGIVAEWSDSIESADHYTRGHCERVANYACALAEAAGVDPAVLLWFRMGALLHDVGKIEVPPEVLNKPGALTPEERRLMERHPDAGVELIANVEFPWDIRPMVRHHHEAWDGSGYPAGLKGDGIPLAARILCVADVYDALSTDRPYRPAFTHGQTLEIMAREAGTRLDPRLFDLFRRLDLHQASSSASN